jgi:hypothetical protein
MPETFVVGMATHTIRSPSLFVAQRKGPDRFPAGNRPGPVFFTRPNRGHPAIGWNIGVTLADDEICAMAGSCAIDTVPSMIP